MAVNVFRDHLLIIQEDDANRQVVNGFLLHSNVKIRQIQALPISGGWIHVLNDFKAMIPEIRRYPGRHVLLVLDFDEDFTDRIVKIRAEIPSDIVDRVYVLGTFSEPEALKGSMGCSLEAIGIRLSNDCFHRQTVSWDHSLLIHNAPEIQRVYASVRSFIF